MKRRKLITPGVILSLSIFSSASCLAADDDIMPAGHEVLYHLFGPKDSVEQVKEIEALTGAFQGPPKTTEEKNRERELQRKADAEEKRLSDERLAKQAEYKREADIASERKKVELARQGLWKEPVMASDQGEKATEKFIETVSGNNKGAGGETSNQPNNARDQARDGAWEAAKAAASDVRGSVRSTIDGMKNCPDGH
jgi:hypothetical protein